MNVSSIGTISRLLTTVVLIILLFLNLPSYGQTTDLEQRAIHDHSSGKVILLSRDLEMRLAVNALPKELRDSAAILALGPGGYEKIRAGSNPFTCIVSRRGGNFYPVCFDEEGTRTIMPAFTDDALLRLKGLGEEEIERRLAAGFESGHYRPPSRPGIAYMLSPATYMTTTGKLIRTPPHTMFYAPFLTNSDVGCDPEIFKVVTQPPSPGDNHDVSRRARASVQRVGPEAIDVDDRWQEQFPEPVPENQAPGPSVACRDCSA